MAYLTPVLFTVVSMICKVTNPYCVTGFDICSALLCAKFLSNPRRMHSGQKEGHELLRTVICYKPPLLSPFAPPPLPPPHIARLSRPPARSRDRILEFSQELGKICAAANNFDFCVYFGMSGRYKQPVQYGRDSAHKRRAAWAVFSLGVCMRERQHIYEDLNRSSSASPGGSHQLEIPPSLNSKRGANFFQIR
jgi:hypothetical protein